MSRSATWQNKDGLEVGFGKHTTDFNATAVTAGRGLIRTAVLAIDGPTLATAAPTALTRVKQAPTMPRGSTILRATLSAKTAFTGTGTITIGTWGVNLTTELVDDADGIDATVDVDVALSAIGSTVACDGALVGVAGTKTGATSDSDTVVLAFATGSVTAGTAELIIEYIPPITSATIAV